MSCVPSGFGTGLWGKTPWGGSLAPDVGGPLPDVPPFDIYCVGPCGPISSLLTHTEVSTVGDGTQFPLDAVTGDQMLGSGGTFTASEAATIIAVPVPEDFTFEFTALWENLPVDFNDLVHEHSYFGTFTSSAGCVGLFFSKVGIAYAGSVHLDGSNSMVIDTPVQDLPNSQLLVSEDEYWTVRVAMSFTTGTVYVYVTKTSDLLSIGHQLRYVLPAIASASAAQVPPNETLVAARGLSGVPTVVQVNSICLGTGLIIPNVPPHADPGADQAVRVCSILRLDGTKSFDPQGAALTYHWRLIDAPLGSASIFDGTDGRTIPGSPPTGLTDRLYSVTLGVMNSQTMVVAGDVIVLAGVAYSITSTGTDGTGFYVHVDGYVLPDSLSTNTAFKYLRQNGLNTPTSAQPTFYPDVPGFYKFDLVVFNGALFSTPPVVVVANVVESTVARGCTPDVSFLWNYLSDFWRQIEDPERITTFWQGMAQVAAAELLTLWQIDYGKSLRDIQRTFQRRWLHYDLLMQENPNLIEVSAVRAVYGGIESSDIPTAGLTSLGGTHLDLQLATLSYATIIPIPAASGYTASQLQAFLQSALLAVDSRVVVRVIANRAGTASRVRIDAPFPITVLSSSTAPVYTAGQANAMPTGTAGVAVGVQTYRVERSLQFLSIQPNDFLCIDGVAYRIARIVDVASDPFAFQRFTLRDPLPTPVGANWSISGTAISNDLDFWNGLCEQSDQLTFEVLKLVDQSMFEVTSTVVGASEALTHNLPVDATPVGAYLAQPALYSVFFKSVRRRRYVPIDPLIVDVPLLQENIASKDDTQVLRRNVDYFLETFRSQPCIRFVTPVPLTAGGPDVWQGVQPPDRMWAETSYLDNRPRIEGTFGLPASFTLDDLAQLPTNIDYLSAVRGLWYAYLNGPTLFNLRAGTQILIGLPFAEEAGTIVEIRSDFSSTTGRILMQDLADATIVRSYSFPASLSMEVNPSTNKLYAVGDAVAQFAPLVSGVEVLDYIKDPKWFQGYLEQGSFFEVEKFFKFLVRVDSAAFNLAALLFVQNFILRIKPRYTYPLFVVLEKIGNTDISVATELDLSGTLSIYDGACFDGTLGAATMFDQPRPAGGGWRSQFDHNQNPAVIPTFPTPTLPIVWGYDKNYLCPEDFILATLCTTFSVPTLPSFDSIFEYDLPLYTADQMAFSSGRVLTVPASPGLQVEGSETITTNGTLNSLILEIQSILPGTPATYNLVIKQNGTVAVTTPITLSTTGFVLQATISVPVLIGDVITCFIVSTASGPIAVDWEGILIEIGQATTWAFDATLAPGTYCVLKVL